MSRKRSLAAAVQAATRVPDPVVPAAEPTGAATYQPPSRRGKKAITVHFDPAVVQQLKIIGAEQNRPMQALMAEAVNDFLAKSGRSAIA